MWHFSSQFLPRTAPKRFRDWKNSLTGSRPPCLSGNIKNTPTARQTGPVAPGEILRTVTEHLAAVLALGHPLPSQLVPIGADLARYLTRDIAARYAVPPFDNSAMDGYALRHADLQEVPAVLQVVGDVPAGTAATETVEPGEAMRIMTGAPLPQGADTVVPVELTDQEPGDHPLPAHVKINEAVTLGRHIRRAGENAAAGDAVLNQGMRATPAAAAAAASVGVSHWQVTARPRVAVIATGAELREPGQTLGPGEIPDSNSLLLSGLVEQFGGEVAGAYRVEDEPAAFTELIGSLTDADVIVTSGGISAGAFEVVRQSAGGAMEFVTVGMQPGKPQGIGLWPVAGRRVPMLAFPGNPVSVFVSAWLFLRPLVQHLAGVPVGDARLGAVAAESWRPPVGREQYLPVVWRDSGIVRAHQMGSGSHAIASLHLAQGLAIVPADVERVQVGDELEVIDLRAGF